MAKKKVSYLQWFLWAAVGILTGLIVALSIVTESGSLNDFYSGGEVYDGTIGYRTANLTGMVYDSGERKLYITEEKADKICNIRGSLLQWNYLLIDISGMEAESLDVVLDFYNGVELVGRAEEKLYNGRNLVSLVEQPFNVLQMRFDGQSGVSFSIDKIQFREKLVEVPTAEFLGITALVFLAYAVITCAVCKVGLRLGCGKDGWYRFVDFLQDVYLAAGGYAAPFTGKMSGRLKRILRVSLFAFLILFMMVRVDLIRYEYAEDFKWGILVCAAVTFLIALCCHEGKLKRQNWKNGLVCAWVILWGMACVLDWITPKRYAFTGYVMLFVMGFFYFMWNNMKDREQVVRDFLSAVVASFILLSVFCFVCRPLQENLRYLGSYYNPVMFGNYVLFVWIALLGVMDCRMKEKESFRWRAAVPASCGLALAFFFMWKTQSSTSLIPAAMTMAVFAVRNLSFAGERQKRKRAFLFLSLFVVLLVPVSAAAEWGLKNIPGRLGTAVRLERDEGFGLASMPFEPEAVYAAEASDAENGRSIKGSRIFKRVFSASSVEEFTSARNFYWLEFLRGMNVLGHNRNTITFWGNNNWPHNGFLAFMYRYGVYAVFPYAVIVFGGLYAAWGEMCGKNRYGYYLFAAMLAAFFLILLENLEKPFWHLSWMTMYFMMGYFFPAEKSGQGG